MADVYELWKSAFPKIVQSVTGRGVWAALNAVRPVALEDGVFVLGFAAEDSELTGHLRIHATQRVIETVISAVAGTPAVTQKSLAQNRARFYEEAIELVVGARQEMTVVDDAAERSFARCIERIAQYVEIPTTIVAIEILKRSGEL